MQAFQVTDSQGRHAFLGRDLFRDGMHAQRLGRAPRDIWSFPVEIDQREIPLVRLLGRRAYNLLANRLMEIEGIPADTMVRHGSENGIIEIQAGGARYRAKGTTIYKKR